jgi:hypothetical protein
MRCPGFPLSSAKYKTTGTIAERTTRIRFIFSPP